MSCKNLKVRKRKYKPYFYCSFLKSEINKEECQNCSQKEYKKIKPMKSHKHKRTIATSIPSSTKKIVWERDKHQCVICHTEVPIECACCHFIRRSQRWKRNPRKYIHCLL